MPIHTLRHSEGDSQDGADQRERRYRRFDLQLPARLNFSYRGMVHELETVSWNVSIAGVLLRSKDSLPLQTQVSLTMDAQSPRSFRSIRLVSDGEVVRVERLDSDAGYAIAIRCNHPISEMKNYLAATG